METRRPEFLPSNDAPTGCARVARVDSRSSDGSVAASLQAEGQVGREPSASRVIVARRPFPAIGRGAVTLAPPVRTTRASSSTHDSLIVWNIIVTTQTWDLAVADESVWSLGSETGCDHAAGL